MRNKQIDGLRGITIFLIVIYHVFCRYSEIYLNRSIPLVKYFGSFGNSVFLLISAYFLTGEWGGRRICDISSVIYNCKALFFVLKKRVTRLWPCYAVSITLTSIIIHLFYLPGRMSSWKDYFLNLFWINGYIGTPYVDASHWYITTLLSAIFLVGMLNALSIQDNCGAYCMLMILEGLSKIFGITWLNTLLCSSHIGIIVLGICLGNIEKKKNNISSLFQYASLKKYYKNNKWIILAIISWGYYFARRGVIAAFCAIIAIILVVLALKLKLPFTEMRILQFLGIISYPLYLIHQNVSYEIEYNLMKVNGNHIFLYGIIAIVVSILCGTMLYLFVEEPIQRITKRPSKKG